MAQGYGKSKSLIRNRRPWKEGQRTSPMKVRAQGKLCKFTLINGKKCSEPTMFHHMFCPYHWKIMREETQRINKERQKRKEELINKSDGDINV